MFKYFWFSKEKSFLKNILNILFWFFVLLAVFYLSGQNPLTDHPVFSGLTAFFSALTIALPYIIYQKTRLKEKYNIKFPLILESLIALSLILGWLGTFKFYQIGIGYDSFIHFSVSFLGALMAFIIGSVIFGVKKKKKIVLMIFLVVIFVGIFNEFFQKYGDMWWGTEMFGEIGQPNDTSRDLIYDTLGIFAGISLVLFNGEEWIRGLKNKKGEHI